MVYAAQTYLRFALQSVSGIQVDGATCVIQSNKLNPLSQVLCICMRDPLPVFVISFVTSILYGQIKEAAQI